MLRDLELTLDAVDSWLELGRDVVIRGDDGSGRSTALRGLAIFDRRTIECNHAQRIDTSTICRGIANQFHPFKGQGDACRRIYMAYVPRNQ